VSAKQARAIPRQQQGVARKLIAIATLALAVTVTIGVPPASASGNRTYTATFVTPEGRFRTVIDDPASVARLDDAVRAQDLRRVGIPNGVVVRGDGGVNRGHQWHLEDVTLVDMTIEVCDGSAAYLDAHLDEWLRDVGRYCPWGARLVSFIRR
jgi:hypothetical protein